MSDEQRQRRRAIHLDLQRAEVRHSAATSYSRSGQPQEHGKRLEMDANLRWCDDHPWVRINHKPVGSTSMRLISLTIENFRSIRKARKIPTGQITTLIGPNNEGKSNILRALAIGMSTLVSWDEARVRSFLYRRSTRRRRSDAQFYDWFTDYPLPLQASKPKGSSTIVLEFELDEQEVTRFYESTGSKLNGTLPIQISFSREGNELSVAKQGRGQKTLNARRDRIVQFISERIDVQYIPAVRTAENAQNIINTIVEGELRKAEGAPEFSAALEKIQELQAPILRSLSEAIGHTIRQFIPGVQSAEIKVTNEGRALALRASADILIDDGVSTLLQFKGDGVQSLVALAVMRHASELRSTGGDIIVALEEPESHLHPRAAHELKRILDELAVTSQVVLTTHNPVFVNRADLSSNMIVQQNRAYQAKSIDEIRSILGVRVSDNLQGAELVLIVEGEEDSTLLHGVLRVMSEKLSDALDSGRLVIDASGGAGNLPYKVALYKSLVCPVHVFLDHDKAGRDGYEKCEQEGLLTFREVNFALVDGYANTEMEDLLDDQLMDNVLAAHSISLKTSRKKKAKWSERLASACVTSGKPFNANLLAEIKKELSRQGRPLGESAFHPSKVGPIRSLRDTLESRLR